jgi:hypothetical protein
MRSSSGTDGCGLSMPRWSDRCARIRRQSTLFGITGILNERFCNPHGFGLVEVPSF